MKIPRMQKNSAFPQGAEIPCPRGSDARRRKHLRERSSRAKIALPIMFSKYPALFALATLPLLAFPPQSAAAPAPVARERPAAAENAPEITSLPVSGIPRVWLQGDPVEAWKKDEVCIFEFWATWCGPCLAAIPHLNALHRQISDEKLPARIVGVNVFDESSPARLKKFLAARPVPPEYAVAIDAEKTATREWLRPLDVSGIPFALAVRGGRILWKGNPNALSPELLRALCDENFSQEKRKSETRKREGAARAEMRRILKLHADGDLGADAALRAFLGNAAVAADDKLSLADALCLRALAAEDFSRTNALLRLKAEAFPQDFSAQMSVARFILETEDIPERARDLALAEACVERADALCDGDSGKKIRAQTTAAEIFSRRGDVPAQRAALRRAWEASAAFARLNELSAKLPDDARLADVLSGNAAVPADFVPRENDARVPAAPTEATPQPPPRPSASPEAREALAFLNDLDWIQGAPPQTLPENGVAFLDIWLAPEPGPFEPLWHRIPARRIDELLGRAAESVPVCVLALEHSPGRIEKTLAFPRFATRRPVADLSAAGDAGEAFLKKLGVEELPAVVALRDGKPIWRGVAQDIPAWLVDAAQNRDFDPEKFRERRAAERAEYDAVFLELVNIRKRIIESGDPAATEDLVALRERLTKFPALDMIAAEILAGTFYAKKDYAGVGAVCAGILKKYPSLNFIAEHQLKILNANLNLRAENLPVVILACRNILAAGTPHATSYWLLLSRTYEECGDIPNAVFAAACARDASREYENLRRAENAR